jgi:hypothetical protein
MSVADYFNSRIDPIKFINWLWPDIVLYPQQKRIINSVWDNDVTVVPAGHMLGKDFVTGLICVAFFLTRTPCRIITTSVDSKQLEGVLWGEINRFINTAKFPLREEQGGPLRVNHLHIRQIENREHGKKVVDRTYLIGRVAEKGEGLSGHHIERREDGIPRTLFVADEVSAVDPEALEKPTEWAHRQLWIGNPYQCNNPFKWAVDGRPGTEDRGGDIPKDDVTDAPHPLFYRKVIRIRAVDSPNIRYAMKEIERGKAPSRKIIIPGVLTYDDYILRRKTWDEVKQTVGLDAEFYEGESALLFPPYWMDIAEQTDDELKKQRIQRVAIAGGCDTGEGRADTVFTCCDDYGIIDMVEMKTPDSAIIIREAINFINKHNIPHERMLFDRGGGGRQIADMLRERGYNVQTIAFGSGVGRPGDDGIKRRTKKREVAEVREDKGVYTNRRSQMYGEFSEVLDPNNLNRTRRFGIPRRFFNIRQQLAVIPRRLDGEGKIYLPAKNKKRPNSTEETMEDLIGRSPDHADSVVLCIHSLLHPPKKFTVGAIDWNELGEYNIRGGQIPTYSRAFERLLEDDN